MSTAQNLAYARLRNAILKGAFAPGTQLRQEDLAEKFKMSRTSVRFAIQALADDGLVEIGDTRRSFVADVSLTRVEETYDILSMLEPYSAGLAAERAGEQDVRELRKLIDQMSETLDDDLAYLETNSKFHRKIHQLSGNPTLNELIDRIVDFPQTLYLKFGKSTESATANRDHARIVDAIESGDKNLAILEMKLHIETRRRESHDLWSKAMQT
ncbi:MAG: GntR family transcriptional regulator [Chromatiales bacterium]|jgi:DNA-binding GntR family transcriptional regulator|nr:MAG: GntR family transcriptional regulator [Chromatiales bacterium]